MGFEDYTSFTTIDPNSHIDIHSSTHVVHDAYRNEECYMYKDYGVSHFKNFEHVIDVKMVFTSNYGLSFFWGIADYLETYRGLLNDSRDGMFSAIWKNSFGERFIGIWELEHGVRVGLDTTVADVIQSDSWYYLTIEKSGTTWTCKIYSDEVKETLVDTLTITLQNNYEFRYFFGCNVDDNDVSPNHNVASIRNLDFQEPVTYTQKLFEGVQLSDVFTRTAEYRRTQAEALQVADGISKIFTRLIPDTIQLEDEASKKTSKILDETATLQDVPDFSGCPTVVTLAAQGITSTSATLWGEVTDLNKFDVDEQGFEWGKTQGGPYTFTWSESGLFGLNSFDFLAINLDPNVTYYFRALAHNTIGWGYGEEGTLTTDPDLPTVITRDPTGVGLTSAILHGEITDLGGEDCSTRGFDYGTIGPGTYDLEWTKGGTFGLEAYSKELSTLTQDVIYYYRAKAMNSAGWDYGAEKSFTPGAIDYYDDPVFKVVIGGNTITSDCISVDVTLRENKIADALIIANDEEGKTFLSNATLEDEVLIYMWYPEESTEEGGTITCDDELCGFETGDLQKWDSDEGLSVICNTEEAHHGNWCGRSTSGYAYKNFPSVSGMSARLYIKFKKIPTFADNNWFGFLGILQGANYNVYAGYGKIGGVTGWVLIDYMAESIRYQVSATPALVVDQWYKVQISTSYSPPYGYVYMWINDQLVLQREEYTPYYYPVNRLFAGAFATGGSSNIEVIIDCVWYNNLSSDGHTDAQRAQPTHRSWPSA